uniref:CCHC-type domain-containing protein n=1 Tax=Cannabis sativa TaxID=3483 RepID=A0A803NT62_CANSA
MSLWDYWIEEALSKLHSLQLLRSLRPIYLRNEPQHPTNTTSSKSSFEDEFQVFDEMHPWDRSSVEIQISDATFQNWVHHISSSGDEADSSGHVLADSETGECPRLFKKLLLFSGNDYLGLSSHPTIGKAAAKAALKHGMGPRGSALICGYTNYHRLLESCLADLKKKEDCLLCPTGFAANMAVMVTLGNVSSLLASGSKPLQHERVAIFSDAFNHASIIDGMPNKLDLTMQDLLDHTSNLRVVDEDGWEVYEDRETKEQYDAITGLAGEIIELQQEDVTKIALNGFFWFKVWISIDKPICPGFLFPCSGGRVWLSFRYERLPFMCFSCGRVGHDYRTCARNPVQITYGDGKSSAAYGAWLKIEEGPSGGRERKTQGRASGDDLGRNRTLGKLLDSVGSGRSNKDQSLGNSILVFEWSQDKDQGDERLPRINNPQQIMGQIEGDGGSGSKKRAGSWDSLNLGDGMNKQPGKRIHMEGSNLQLESKQGKSIERGEWIDIHITFVNEIGDGSSGPKRGRKKKLVARKNNKFLPWGISFIADLTSRVTLEAANAVELGRDMNILIWNVQGLGNPWTLKTLSSHVKEHHPGMIFLFETRLKEEAMERIQIVLSFDGYFVVAAKGKSGGLALLWKDPWERFTGFYGSPDPGGRKSSWQLLERLRNLSQGAWICGAISYCNFKEIWMDGGGFTWCNGRQNNLAFEKLDRVLANPEWFTRIWASKVTLLPWWNSDHRPLKISFNKDQQLSTKDPKWRSRFHYEKAWAGKRSAGRLLNRLGLMFPIGVRLTGFGGELIIVVRCSTTGIKLKKRTWVQKLRNSKRN